MITDGAFADGMEFWTPAELEANCNVLNAYRCWRPIEDHSHFMHVPYFSYSVKVPPAEAYMEMVGDRVTFYLVRVDLSDVRHVVVGFKSEADQAAFLETRGIVVRRHLRPETA
jgi:hypothetical protein